MRYILREKAKFRLCLHCIRFSTWVIRATHLTSEMFPHTSPSEKVSLCNFSTDSLFCSYSLLKYDTQSIYVSFHKTGHITLKWEWSNFKKAPTPFWKGGTGIFIHTCQFSAWLVEVWGKMNPNVDPSLRLYFNKKRTPGNHWTGSIQIFEQLECMFCNITLKIFILCYMSWYVVNNLIGGWAGLAQYWERLPSTNVS